MKGVLWSHVYKHPAFEGVNAVSSDPASYYFDGDAGIQEVSLGTGSSPFGGAHVVNNLITQHVHLPAPCQSCTLPEGDLLVLPAAATGTTTLIAQPDGDRWFVATHLSRSVVDLAAQIDSGTLHVVRASESWATLKRAGTPLRGVALDNGNRPVMSIQIDTLGEVQARPTGSEGGLPLGSSEVTFSALHGGRIFIYGDHEPQVKVHTLDGIDHVFPLDAGARPRKVLASAWRDQWGAIYAVDRAGQRTRLVRWEYGSSHFDVVAEWPGILSRGWRFWLNPMPGGDLLLTASRKHGRLAVLTRFSVEAPGELELRGIRVVHERVVGRPSVDYSRAQMLVLRQGLRYRTVRVDSFTSHSGPWTPILKAHHGEHEHDHHERQHGHHERRHDHTAWHRGWHRP